MNLENMSDDETKEITLKPCTKQNKTRRAKDIDPAGFPCKDCNKFGMYMMFNHTYICDEYDGGEK